MKKAFYISIILSVFLFACKKENRGDCFKGVGSQTEEMRSLLPFNRIVIDKDVDVTLVPDTAEFVIVRCGENLIDLIKTDVSGTELTITNANKCNWVRNFNTPIKAEVHLISISSLYFKGSGNVNSTDTLRSANFKLEAYNASGNIDITVRNGWNEVVQHTGNADLKVNGWAPYNTMYSGGNGFLDCRNLKCNTAYVLHRGTGNFYVKADDYLDVEINLIGNVYYWGNPAINQVISSSGKLIQQ